MEEHAELQFEFGRSLEKSVASYRKQVRRASRKLTPDAVHDVRVASRRLMAALDAVHLLLRSERSARIRKHIKKDLRNLGPLRDLQMQIELARTELRSGGRTDKFIEKLEKQEKRLKSKAASEIRRIDTKKVKKPIAAFNRRVSRPLAGVDPDHFLFTLNSIVDATFARVVDRSRALNLHDNQSFHLLRVQFKTFRYLLEFLQAPLGISEDQIGRMNRYQDVLGRMHDLMVLIAKLERFFEKQGTRQPAQVVELRRLEGRLDAMLRVFMADDAPTVYDFWRSVPVRVSADALKSTA